MEVIHPAGMDILDGKNSSHVDRTGGFREIEAYEGSEIPKEFQKKVDNCAKDSMRGAPHLEDRDTIQIATFDYCKLLKAFRHYCD